MEWSENLVRVLNRIGDELGRIRRIMEGMEGRSEGEESVEKERKDDGERSESGSKTEEEERSINGEEWWERVMRREERRRKEEKADEVAAEGRERQRMESRDGRRKEGEELGEGEIGEEGRREEGETEGRMVEVLSVSEEEWREWCWGEKEKRKDEKEGKGGIKEGEEEVGKITWQTGESIRRWVEEEEARRRVGLAGTRKRVDSGDEDERRKVEEVEKEGWRVAGRNGGVGGGEKKSSQEGEKSGVGESEEKRAVGREEGRRQVKPGGKVEEKEERGGKEEERQREVDRREEDEREKTRRLREKVKRMEEEREQKQKRRRNVIFRGLDGRDAEERRGFMERVTEKVMGRMPRVRRVWERRGIGGKEVVLVEMEDEKERGELLEKYWEFRQRWGIGVDEDLTMEERRTKWRIMEKARVERERGRRVMTDNRRIWVEGKEIFWNEEEEKWEEK